MPSGFTLASAAAVVVAGIWLAASSSSASDAVKPAAHSPSPKTHPRPSPPSTSGRHATGGSKARERAHPVPHVLVDVFNNSAVSGLAATKAAALHSAGWNVAGADDWHGDIPANTVYYPPRLRHAAEALAAALGVHRLRPAVTPMQFDRLTVIFTAP
jgi:hypothetical protein